jgi:hypothetical protein
MPYHAYPNTVAFAYNWRSETVFYCELCAKERFGERPHDDGCMMVDYHTDMSFIQCEDCDVVLKRE